MEFIEFYDDIKWKTLAEVKALFADRGDADALEAKAFLSLLDDLYTAGDELYLAMAGNTSYETIDLLTRAAAVRGDTLSEVGRKAILYATIDGFYCGGSTIQFYPDRRVRILFSETIDTRKDLLELAEKLCQKSFAASLYCIMADEYKGLGSSEMSMDAFAPFVSSIREDILRRNADSGDAHAASRYALLGREGKDSWLRRIRAMKAGVILLVLSYCWIGFTFLADLLSGLLVPILENLPIMNSSPTEVDSFLASRLGDPPAFHPDPPSPSRIILVLGFLVGGLILLILIVRKIRILEQRRKDHFGCYDLTGGLSEAQNRYVVQQDLKKTEQYLKKAYQLDESYAGVYAEFLHYYTKERDEAKKILSRAVERNDANAMMVMRSLFLGPRAELLQKAAELENPEALTILAIDADMPAQKKKYYEHAAERGSEVALSWMSQKLARGSLIYQIKKDPVKSYEYAKRAAESGNPHGLTQLGWCYEHGVGVPVQKEKAVQCYQYAIRIGGQHYPKFPGIISNYTSSSLGAAGIALDTDQEFFRRTKLIGQSIFSFS